MLNLVWVVWFFSFMVLLGAFTSIRVGSMEDLESHI